MRLLDTILQNGFSTERPDATELKLGLREGGQSIEEGMKRAKMAMASIPRFDISNVFSYFVTNGGDGLPRKIKELPCIAPPFDSFWLEGQVHGQSRRVGALVLSTKISAGSSTAFPPGYPSTEAERFSRGWDTKLMFFANGWPGRSFESATNELCLFIDSSTGQATGGCIRPVEGFLGEPSPAAVQSLVDVGIQCLFAVSLLHCKNVVADEEQISPKLQKARAKRGREALTFRVLRVGEAGGSGAGEKIGMGAGTTQRFHICRGHFKRFTEEKKLFGKHVGWFWWESHTRGSLKEGVAEKEYAVDGPLEKA